MVARFWALTLRQMLAGCCMETGMDKNKYKTRVFYLLCEQDGM